ncbi:MAG: hypothetical protein ACOYNZ_01795 [Rhodoferax sp.]
MAPIVLLNHFLNFLAPAFCLAILMTLAGRIFFRKRPAAPALRTQAMVNFAANTLALGLGFWFFGRDGKMATYLGMTLVSATSQWLMLRGGR